MSMMKNSEKNELNIIHDFNGIYDKKNMKKKKKKTRKIKERPYKMMIKAKEKEETSR